MDIKRTNNFSTNQVAE